MDEGAFAEKLSLLRQSFAAGLTARLATLGEGLAAVRNGRVDALEPLYHTAHTLAGSAGTFGFAEVGAQARSLEQLLKPWRLSGRLPTAEALDEAQWVYELLVELVPATLGSDAAAEVDTPVQRSAVAGRRVCMVGRDPVIAQVKAQLRHFGYEPVCCADTHSARAEALRQPPDAWILDTDLDGQPGAGIALGDELGRVGGGTPLFFMSRRDDLETRLAVARAGGLAYFTWPVDSLQLVDRLNAQLGGHADEPYRILVVDDDCLLAERTAMVLRRAGMRAEWASEAHEVLDLLEPLQPDMLLMDLHMPQCSGMELARVIRQYEAYMGLPIVYLSSEADLNNQYAALAAGGDDFLTKPIGDRNLVLAVTARAARARQLSRLMDTDSLTGLLKHGRIKERLATELSRARRTGNALAFAMLDIDHFKAINDRYGHPMGDRVIKSLAVLLQQRLRRTDSIGRWGGEEFAAILTDCNAAEAYSLLDDLRGQFEALTFLGDAGPFSATVSIGVAISEGEEGVNDLIDKADAALYRAKADGRNRLACAGTAA